MEGHGHVRLSSHLYIYLGKQAFTVLMIYVFIVVSLRMLLPSDVYFVQNPAVAVTVAADVPWKESLWLTLCDLVTIRSTDERRRMRMIFQRETMQCFVASGDGR